MAQISFNIIIIIYFNFFSSGINLVPTFQTSALPQALSCSTWDTLVSANEFTLVIHPLVCRGYNEGINQHAKAEIASLQHNHCISDLSPTSLSGVISLNCWCSLPLFRGFFFSLRKPL